MTWWFIIKYHQKGKTLLTRKMHRFEKLQHKFGRRAKTKTVGGEETLMNESPPPSINLTVETHPTLLKFTTHMDCDASGPYPQSWIQETENPLLLELMEGGSWGPLELFVPSSWELWAIKKRFYGLVWLPRKLMPWQEYSLQINLRAYVTTRDQLQKFKIGCKIQRRESEKKKPKRNTEE